MFEITLMLMCAWLNFSLIDFVPNCFSLQVHELYFPMLNYGMLVAKSQCQWFVNDMVLKFQRSMVTKHSSF
jgi:hypothetical protein